MILFLGKITVSKKSIDLNKSAKQATPRRTNNNVNIRLDYKIYR